MNEILVLLEECELNNQIVEVPIFVTVNYSIKKGIPASRINPAEPDEPIINSAHTDSCDVLPYLTNQSDVEYIFNCCLEDMIGEYREPLPPVEKIQFNIRKVS